MDIDVVDAYEKAEEALYQYFDIPQEWKVYPIEDDREYIWSVDEGQTQVIYAESKAAIRKGDYYGGEIRKKRVIVKEKYTAILMDTNCDGNVFYAIFDNSKRQEHDEDL
jgi:hypothetical protein